MPRWKTAPSDVVLDKVYPEMDDVILEITKLSPYAGKPKDDGSIGIGMVVSLKFTEGDFVNQPVRTNLVFGKILVDGTEQRSDFEAITKQFQMAAYDYPRNAEVEFNTFSEGFDWSFDTDTKQVGDAWSQMIGRSVRANIRVTTNKQTNNPQNAVYFSAISGK